MKKQIFITLFVSVLMAGCNDDRGLFNMMLDNESRIAGLEQLCQEMNTNVSSLQTIVAAQQSGDYITFIAPIVMGSKQIGYTITFAKYGTITIYNGNDGADGVSPVIGVAKHTDGVYYWTLNGKWMLDSGGNMIRTTGADGQNGANGTNGINGTNGTNGVDGITPQLKIEGGYWYVSYNEGVSWTQLGKATGADGQNGANGTNGINGTNGTNGVDGITPRLKIEGGYWYVSYNEGVSWAQLGKATGADGQNGTNGTNGINGTNGTNGVDGITPQLKIEGGYWYVSYNEGVSWTQLGKATGADGQNGTNGTNGIDGKDGDSMFKSVTYDENYVYFTLANGTELKIIRKDNSSSSPSFTNSLYKTGSEKGYDYVDLGLPSGTKWATCNVGASSPEMFGDYYAWGEVTEKGVYTWATYEYGSGDKNLTKYCNESSHGKNGFTDGRTTLELLDDAAYVNWGGKWRMPTKTQWDELIGQCYWVLTDSYNGSGVAGVIVYKAKDSSDKGRYGGSSLAYSLSDAHIFLPEAGGYSEYGYRNHNTSLIGETWGFYWSSSLDTGYPSDAWCACTFSEVVSAGGSRFAGLPVRAVCK